jgi:hypothetical protein
MRAVASFALLSTFLFSLSFAKAGDQLDCSKEAIKCSVLLPLLYKHFAEKAPQAISELDRTDCKSTTWHDAQVIADTLMLAARDAGIGYQAFIRDNYTRSDNAKAIGAAMHDAWEKSAEVKLEIADRAASSGCIEIAETEYQYVLSRYTAPEQQGYQRRAAAGLEDIRSKKGSFMCSWFGRC